MRIYIHKHRLASDNPFSVKQMSLFCPKYSIHPRTNLIRLCVINSHGQRTETFISCLNLAAVQGSVTFLAFPRLFSYDLDSSCEGQLYSRKPYIKQLDWQMCTCCVWFLTDSVESTDNATFHYALGMNLRFLDFPWNTIYSHHVSPLAPRPCFIPILPRA